MLPIPNLYRHRLQINRPAQTGCLLPNLKQPSFITVLPNPMGDLRHKLQTPQ